MLYRTSDVLRTVQIKHINAPLMQQGIVCTFCTYYCTSDTVLASCVMALRLVPVPRFCRLFLLTLSTTSITDIKNIRSALLTNTFNNKH